MITATVSGAHTVHLKRRAQYHRHGTAVISGLNTTCLGGATSHLIILCVTRFKWSTSTWSEQGFLHRLKEPHFFLYCLSASPYMSKDIQIFFFLGKMSYKHRCWGGKKDFLNSWQAELLEFYKFSLFTRKMKQWSRISGMIKTTEAFTSWGWIQYCVCIGINIAWACNMYADGYWIQIRTRPDIQKLLLQFSGRESGWITQTHKYRQLNTHARLSQQFLGSFPVCYILSRKTTNLFVKPSIYDNVISAVQ